MKNLEDLWGVGVGDDGEFTNLDDVIQELTKFTEQFSTHAMSDHVLTLKGREEAYLDVIDYLKRVSPKDYEVYEHE